FQSDTREVATAHTPMAAVSWKGWGRRLVRELAFQDWLIVGYLTALTLAVATSPESAARSHCLGHTVSMLGVCVRVLALVRGGLVRGGLISPLGYRVAIFGMLQLSYFELRELLPIVSPRSLDAELSWIDIKVFHFEPSLFMDRFITPATTEW